MSKKAKKVKKAKAVFVRPSTRRYFKAADHAAIMLFRAQKSTAIWPEDAEVSITAQEAAKNVATKAGFKELAQLHQDWASQMQADLDDFNEEEKAKALQRDAEDVGEDEEEFDEDLDNE